MMTPEEIAAYQREMREYPRTIKAAQEAYDAQWHDHCRACQGAGCHEWPGNYYEPPEWEPCEACVEMDMCPRCGRGAAWGLSLDTGETPFDDLVCMHCGWRAAVDGGRPGR